MNRPPMNRLRMNRLDVATLSLAGQQLIEASAGTGKTHAIANLFLRLVLERNLRAEQILVVTFTNAATDELRARIRHRLATALQRLGEPGSLVDEKDEACRALLESANAAADRDTRIRHLRLQLSAMDDAAIFTIHGFCQRALSESAFSSGQSFTAVLATDTDALLKQAVTDWWRRTFHRDALLASLASGHPQLGSPETLLPLVRRLASREARLSHATGDRDGFAALGAQVRNAWHHEGRALVDRIRELTASSMLSKAGTTLRDDQVDLAVQAMNRFCADADAALPARIAERLTPSFLEHCRSDKAKKGSVAAPAFAVSGLIAALLEGARALEQALLAGAIHACREEVARLKQRDSVFGFDDLITRLRDALAGDGGDALAERLATRYPAALIDECQDTDPAQYAIFRRLYADRPDHCLLMIGDPKQAIYSFRGADVFAYLGAKRATPPEARHTLDTNWRSVTPLVQAVNALFDRLGEQAFLYPDAIGFEAVRAAGQAEKKPLRLEGQAPVPLVFDLAPAPADDSKGGVHNKEGFRSLAARATAARIADWLRAAREGRATLDGKPLRLRDLAVLVRTHREGALVQEALRAAGIGSAIASQDNVYASDEAAALQQVLAAIADPANDRLLRRALASNAWRARAPEIEQLRTDEAAADAMRNRVSAYHDTWTRHGFMPMFRRWLHGEGIPGRLWQGGNGERVMTNLLQLAELLQAASRTHPSPEALLKFLSGARALPPGDESHQLRLESDENLVQIVTLHKSKGLQYPIVFLPFLACARKTDEGPPTLWHDDEGTLLCSLNADAQAAERAAHEGLAEDLRLAYVALTRAQYQCVIGWGGVNNGELAALAWLLLGDAGPAADIAGWQARVRAMKHDARCEPVRALAAQYAGRIAVDAMPDTVHPLEADTMTTAHWDAFRPARPVTADWQLTSYSRLAGSRDEAATPWTGSAREETTATDGIAAFPRGRKAGHFFHGLMEQLDFPFARGETLARQVDRQLARHGFALQWRDVIAGTVGNVLDTPLSADGLTLRGIDRTHRRDECEFWFPLHALRADRLSGLLAGVLPPLDAQAPDDAHTPGASLPFAPVTGLMQGFIDLLFEHDGRWYLADWKTNWLGPTLDHYGPAALQAAMREHRYDLQYSLYSVALHRHLASRLPDYDIARHFGGVYYFFVRGMRPENGTGTGVFFRRATPADILALDAAMDERGAA